MEKEFIPYDRALRLKELGFNEPCLGYYTPDGTLKIVLGTSTEGANNGLGPEAPTFSQAFRWFREKYNLQSAVKFTHTKYSFEVHFERLANGENPPVMVWHLMDSWLGLNLDLFETYEEAELACLDKLIEIVELNQNKDE